MNRMQTAKDEGVFELSWYAFGKKTPENYDKLVIPEIQRITKHIKGDVIKNKIYNYLIYYWNQGKTAGILESIYIHSREGVKRIKYQIEPGKINLELIREESCNT